MKRNIKKISLSIIACIITLIVLTTSVYAADVSEYFSTLGETKQVSKQYEEWSKLSDEEKERVYEPLKYDIDDEKEEENVFGVARRIGASLESRYDLRDLIPENMEIILSIKKFVSVFIFFSSPFKKNKLFSLNLTDFVPKSFFSEKYNFSSNPKLLLKDAPSKIISLKKFLSLDIGKLYTELS